MTMGILREELRVSGAVQGVGFRPFVYRLAHGLGLSGWIENTPHGVTIQVEGSAERLGEFRGRLRLESPRHARLDALVVRGVAPLADGGFVIRESEPGEPPTAALLPDIATCAACLQEMRTPADRRYRYPFVNCTDCGPRYSIVLDLPYDRDRTTMRRFELCAACRREYGDPHDRRFHAEPTACPRCGPCLALWDADGRALRAGEAALAAAAAAVVSGRIVAVKGLGGFHLLVDAQNENAVRELRRRKRREEKPLAVMCRTPADVGRIAEPTPAEAALLASAAAPIVIVRGRSGALARGVAPGSRNLGVLLPYTPLHHLLMEAIGRPVVATSGNVSEEPLCTSENEAVARLADIADLFLVHDRPIARPVDDSVLRVVAGRPLFLRRARGYAPLALPVSPGDHVVLAVGGHAKSAVALGGAGAAVLSPHIGDLENALALSAFERTIERLSAVYAREPKVLAVDAHPDYESTRWARRQGRPLVEVQHHHAHVLACMADNGLRGPVTGVAWDGSGYGLDGTIWGGETLRVDDQGFERVAWLRRFPLPGGERAVREPRRAALGLLWELRGEACFGADEPIAAAFSAEGRAVLRTMLRRGVGAPLTSSAGRLFDAVAALLGRHLVAAFEAQAAMAVELLAEAAADDDGVYPFEARIGGACVLDWGPMIEALCAERRAGVPATAIAVRVHNTLVEMIVRAARHAERDRVVLTGGCFQNRYLTERAVRRLREEGFEPYWHRDLPPNDGGLAVGQLVAALRRKEG
jgi:hydrogenase maturation protein HypF